MTIKAAAPSWGDLNIEGDAEASNLIAEARDTENPCLITARIRAMLADGAAGGRDTGFIFRLAHAAMNGI